MHQTSHGCSREPPRIFQAFPGEWAYICRCLQASPSLSSEDDTINWFPGMSSLLEGISFPQPSAPRKTGRGSPDVDADVPAVSGTPRKRARGVHDHSSPPYASPLLSLELAASVSVDLHSGPAPAPPTPAVPAPFPYPTASDGDLTFIDELFATSSGFEALFATAADLTSVAPLDLSKDSIHQ